MSIFRNVWTSALIALGFIFMLVGLFSTGAAPGTDHLNFGLLIDKIANVLFGIGLFIAGFIARVK